MQLTHFKVMKYRNVENPGWIEVNDITAFVGQNEAGKSNLFEALYRINPFAANEAFDIDEDWPVDDWENKDASAIVCKAKFALDAAEIESLYDEAVLPDLEPDQEGDELADESPAEQGEESEIALPSELVLIGSRSYSAAPEFVVAGNHAEDLDSEQVDAWAKKHAPKFVLIQDYGLSGTQIELNQLADRYKNVNWHELTNEDLPVDGSDMITKRVEAVLINRYGHTQLDKRRVLEQIMHRFDTWERVSDLPKGTLAKAEKLFKAINSAFEDAPD